MKVPGPRLHAIVLALLAVAAGTSCGRRGAPLPPLIQVPSAPTNLTAERRGNTVTLQLTVPGANTDDTRPANIANVEIYALSGPPSVSDAEILAKGMRVTTVPVRMPGDQGVVARVEDQVSPQIASGPGDVRTYIGVAVTPGGRRGPLSARVAVPLDVAPGAPAGATATYDERALTLQWQPVAEPRGTVGYSVYETEPPGDRVRRSETRLTGQPLADARYVDTRMTWGSTRCYLVRAVLRVNGLDVEGADAASLCVTLTDTFPPARPTGLQAVAGEGAISLIWDANPEADLDGYIVLRAVRPAAPSPITPMPLRQTTYRDEVQAGVAYVYAIVAVDRAGNRSQLSDTVEETAR